MRPLSRGCFVLYAGCCFCNWSLHLAWGADNAARGVLRWQEVLYLVSLSLLARRTPLAPPLPPPPLPSPTAPPPLAAPPSPRCATTSS